MRIARSAADVETAYAEAQAEARAAFGGDRVYLEKLIDGGRHVEIQLFADRYGHAEHIVNEKRSSAEHDKAQLDVAAGAPLPGKQSDLVLSGHAIECRINAED